MEDVSLSLDDLARQSGIGTRVIRDYIARGLLPGSQGRGRAAGYSSSHLERLLAIQALRARGRGLADIQQVLERASNDEIAELARGARAIGTDALRPSSALDYLDSMKSALPAPARSFAPAMAPPPPSPLKPMPLSTAEALANLAEHLRAIAGYQPRPRARSAEWVRVAVNQNLEIAARGPLDTPGRLALERVADAIRALTEPENEGKTGTA